MRARRGSRGQATPLWAIILVLSGLLLLPTGKLLRATLERAQARSAADAAALAGALEGEDAAREIATDNGAVLVDYDEFGNLIEVTVVVGSRRASARAVRELNWSPGPGAVGRES